MKSLSCGFIIFDKESGKLLACHPTGRPKNGYHCYDIPKGHLEDGENPFETACRELTEETGIVLPTDKYVVDLGMMAYRPEKDLHLFAVELDKMDIESMKCSSTFDKDGWQVPEMDGYILTDECSRFYKSLEHIISEVYADYKRNLEKYRGEE